MAAYRVMVVGEDHSFRSIVAALLKQWDYQVFPAADSLDALRQIYYVSPHVVVSDVQLNNYAGFELLPFLRRRFPEIGVVVLTRDNAATTNSAHRAIADGVVSIEPFNPELLANCLLQVSAEFPFRRTSEVDASNSSSSNPEGSGPTMELAPLEKTPWKVG